MMNYSLPTEIEINGVFYPIRNNGDYRVILDVLAALNDSELDDRQRAGCALFIFYENVDLIEDKQAAVDEMIRFISNGDENDGGASLRLMDWEQDFRLIVSPVNRILGCEVRSVPYMHWWTFLSGYMEIGECTFSNVVNIRRKKQKGQRLEKWEEEFYRENRKMIDLPLKLTPEEQAELASEW